MHKQVWRLDWNVVGDEQVSDRVSRSEDDLYDLRRCYQRFQVWQNLDAEGTKRVIGVLPKVSNWPN